MRKKNVAILNGDGTVSVYLGKGYWAKVDTVDLPKIERHKWSALPAKSHGAYAKATIRVGEKSTTLMMQHLIKPKKAGKELDHIDRDKCNNTKKNLRYVTHAVNMRNLPLNKRNKSGISGVNWDKKSKCWVVTAGTKIYESTGRRRPFYVGGFKNLEDAKEARKKAVSRMRGYISSNNI